MIREIVIPDVGPIKEKPKIIRWLKNEGEYVSRGEVLLEIETTKATLEIESSHEGFVRKVFFSEGELVPPLTTIALVGGKDDPLPDIRPGRDSRKPPQAAPSLLDAKAEEVSGDARTRASPLAKKLARERGLDLTKILGTGPGGRITKDDVLGASAGIPGVEGVEVVTLSPARLRIAATVSRSFSTIPHMYVSQEIDMRKARRMKEESGGKMSYDALFLKATALSLRRFPNFNAVMEGNQLRVSPNSNVGFVVETADGIIVPSLRDVADKSLIDITQEITSLANRARDRRLPAEALSGSSFTVSNLGKYGVMSFSAIVYPPQVGILAIGGLRRAPCVVDDQVIPGWMVTVTLSSDHRAVDGAEAARFLNDIKARLEDPDGLN